MVHRGDGWVESFLRNLQTGGGGYRNSEALVILYVVFVTLELHPDVPYSPRIFSSNNNIKTKNYKDFQKFRTILNTSLKKGFGLIKVGIHFNFLITRSLPSHEFKNFS